MNELIDIDNGDLKKKDIQDIFDSICDEHLEQLFQNKILQKFRKVLLT